MILVDTSVWVEHFGPSRFSLTSSLQAGRVVMHPFVLGEIALGSLTNRAGVLGGLASLPQLPVVSNEEVLALIEHRRLWSRGIGLVDANLLASVLISPGTLLASFDKRLASVALELGAGGPASEFV
jgi:predicted nucleic acid-binding protein